MRQTILILLLSIIILAQPSCKSSQQSVHPKAPTKEVIAKAGNAKVSAPVSVIQLPIEISIKDMTQLLNQEMPNGTAIYADDQFNTVPDYPGMAYKTKIAKVNDVRLRAIDDYLYASIPMKVNLSVKQQKGLMAKLRSKPINVEVNLQLNTKSKIDLSSDWDLITKTTLVDYQWLEKPTINILGVKIGVTSIADMALNKMLPSLMPMVDQKIQSKANVKGQLKEAWKLVQKPYLVTKNPANMWLRLMPQSVMMSPIRSENNVMKLAVGMKVISETFITEQAPPDVALRLPTLQKVQSMDDEFSVFLNAGISYDELNEVAWKQMVGQAFAYRKGKKQVQVTDISIYPQQDELIASVEVTGDIKGRIFLRGKPAYDPQKELLYMKSLDFDLDSKNVLLKAGNWLAHGAFVKKIQDQLQFPLGDQLDQLKKEAVNMLDNRRIGENILLKGQLSEIYPQDIILGDDLIQTVLVAKGKLMVKLVK